MQVVQTRSAHTELQAVVQLLFTSSIYRGRLAILPATKSIIATNKWLAGVDLGIVLLPELQQRPCLTKRRE